MSQNQEIGQTYRYIQIEKQLFTLNQILIDKLINHINANYNISQTTSQNLMQQTQRSFFINLDIRCNPQQKNLLRNHSIDKFDISLLFLIYSSIRQFALKRNFIGALRKLKEIRNEIKHQSKPYLEEKQADEYEDSIIQKIQSLDLSPKDLQTIQSIQNESKDKSCQDRFQKYILQEDEKDKFQDKINFYLEIWKSQNKKSCLEQQQDYKKFKEQQYNFNRQLVDKVYILEKEIEKLKQQNIIFQQKSTHSENLQQNIIELKIKLSQQQKLIENLQTQQNIKNKGLQELQQKNNEKINNQVQNETVEENKKFNNDGLIQKIKYHQLSTRNLKLYQKYKQQDFIKKAFQFAEISLNKESFEFMSFLAMGNCFYVMENNLNALKFYQRALIMNPNHLKLKSRIEKLQNQLQRPQKYN